MAKHTDPYGRRWWRGVLLNNRTISALEWVERKSGIEILPTQGSYNAGGVSGSKGTHDGGGAVDLSIKDLPVSKQNLLDHWMRRAGFASWIRQPIPGLWGIHLHAELIGDREASESAKAQWLSFRAHRNGLRDNAYDRAWRPRINRRWNHRLGRPVLHPLPARQPTPCYPCRWPSST